MSKVYSFRLDADNPRESQAREVIDTWVSQGYSLRYILTEALISYQGNGYKEKGWEKVYDQLSELVQGLENGVAKKESVSVKPNISPEFVAAMKQAARQGMVSN